MPFSTAEFAQLRSGIPTPHIASETFELVRRHVHAVLPRVLDDGILPFGTVDFHSGDAVEATDPVLKVDDEISRTVVEEKRFAGGTLLARNGTRESTAKNLVVGENL